MKLTETQIADLEDQARKAAATMNRSNPAPRAQQVFNVAASFHIAAHRNGESRTVQGVINSPTAPMIANLAFAVELYLKSMLYESNKSTKGHDLEQLFNKLTPKHRDGITRHYEVLTGQNKDKLLIDIKSYASVFTEWRYIFEVDTEKPIVTYKLAELARACFLFLREEHPNWPDASVSSLLQDQPSGGVATVISLGGGYMVRAVERQTN